MTNTTEYGSSEKHDYQHELQPTSNVQPSATAYSNTRDVDAVGPAPSYYESYAPHQQQQQQPADALQVVPQAPDATMQPYQYPVQSDAKPLPGTPGNNGQEGQVVYVHNPKPYPKPDNLPLDTKSPRCCEPGFGKRRIRSKG